jgi:DNA-binding Lrp family transcriptional regulator
MIDELDLSLVDALRLDPRASWSRLAGPLGVDPATLSRRWARLSGGGDAWVTCYPSAERMGIGLMLTVAALEPEQITGYVLDRVGRLPGVLRTRTAFVERTLREGSRWREGALDPAQREAIGGTADAAPAPPAEPGLRAALARRALADRTLMQALGADGRMSFAELATRTRLPATTVRRRLGELRESGRLVLRCDASPRLGGHVVGTMLWLDVPPSELDATAGWLGELPATRMCGLVAGSAANVAAYVMTHQVGDARRIEAALAQRFPASRVVGRQVTLRTVKLVGRLLDPDGRARGYVPIDPWQTGPG